MRMRETPSPVIRVSLAGNWPQAMCDQEADLRSTSPHSLQNLEDPRARAERAASPPLPTSPQVPALRSTFRPARTLLHSDGLKDQASERGR